MPIKRNLVIDEFEHINALINTCYSTIVNRYGETDKRIRMLKRLSKKLYNTKTISVTQYNKLTTIYNDLHIP